MTTQAAAVLPRLRRDQIHLYFDPAQEPQIRVPAGARLVVETEDAHMGSIRTENDVYQSLAEVFEKLGGANPVTGPIYVEGVEPGDCVALTFEDIVPGAVQGQGYTVLTPGLGGLVSNYTLQPPLPPRTVICPIEDGEVLFPTTKGTIRIPTRPFLGTIGVAPGGERRLSYLQGAEFLGNTDLPLNGVGATIVMRANVPGGLVSFGDAHAVQGDGEISGGSIAGFTGVHLGDVVRAAYVDIVQRLVQFYGFELGEAYLLACQAARVCVGQVVDPLYCA